MSGRTTWRGTAWDTAASETVDFFVENLPATAATPTGTLKFGYSLNGAAATYPMTLSSTGTITAGTLLPSATGFSLGAGSTPYNQLNLYGTMFFKASFGGADTGTLSHPADGQTNLTNGAVNAGVGLDVTTDAVMKVRTRAQTGYATIDALGINASGTAGASCTIVGATAHLTVVNGIVTLCN